MLQVLHTRQDSLSCDVYSLNSQTFTYYRTHADAKCPGLKFTEFNYLSASQTFCASRKEQTVFAFAITAFVENCLDL